ncbi:cbb3-type cytochrome oxidase assembly protein CcoS [Hydrogenimonas sp. SS33]|uniref:cbb3-type cytochrome oxidase assembly protein CcoS n=1 Tax=Hydrogenimonas leucolamina TaxID=2954236 RepID=UPI00336C1D59
MSSGILAMMLGISTLLGAIGLFALLWGHKTGQFEDKHRFLDGALYDGEEELRDAVRMEEKKKALKEKRKDKRVMPD